MRCRGDIPRPASPGVAIRRTIPSVVVPTLVLAIVAGRSDAFAPRVVANPTFFAGIRSSSSSSSFDATAATTTPSRDTRRQQQQRRRRRCAPSRTIPRARVRRYLSDYIIVVPGDDDDSGKDGDDDDEDDDDEEEEEEDPYMKSASSEFVDEIDLGEDAKVPGAGGIVSRKVAGEPVTMMDWGGALGKLRDRVEDVESGKSRDPSQALFRLMSAQSPNQSIASFVNKASPQVVQAMSGAVASLLGGLSNPQAGTEVIVKASGDKIANLCFQLQMTGYMFRNAEYVMALRDVMDLKGTKTTVRDYKDAFDRLDKDGSGYIEASEVQQLFDAVYGGRGKTPAFEVESFLEFFDKNHDGKISWEEFEMGLGVTMANQSQSASNARDRLLPGTSQDDDDDDDDEDVPEMRAEVKGTIQIEMEDGETVEVEANEYIRSLKAEAEALREALRREKSGGGASSGSMPGQPGGNVAGGAGAGGEDDDLGGIAGYIVSRRGDIKALTEGISPEIVDTMKKLIDFVLEGGGSGVRGASGNKEPPKHEELEMEIPGTALQQLALWQLILGYRLREAEAKGDYKKLLE